MLFLSLWGGGGDRKMRPFPCSSLLVGWRNRRESTFWWKLFHFSKMRSCRYVHAAYALQIARPRTRYLGSGLRVHRAASCAAMLRKNTDFVAAMIARIPPYANPWRFNFLCLSPYICASFGLIFMPGWRQGLEGTTQEGRGTVLKGRDLGL